MQVQVKTNVLAKNDAIAESLQQLFKEKNIFVFNLLGSCLLYTSLNKLFVHLGQTKMPLMCI